MKLNASLSGEHAPDAETLFPYLRGFSVIAAKAIAIIQRMTIAMEKCAKSIMLCFPSLCEA
jgi:hypothetical protein